MMSLLALAKKMAKRLIPYSPQRGVTAIKASFDGKEREGVSAFQVFPPSQFNFPGYKSLDGKEFFPPYTAQIPGYRMFVLKGGLFIYGREETFSRKGHIIEEITAQKINPLKGKRLNLKPEISIKGSVAILGLSGLENGYYHFMVELLLRWWIFNRSGLKADYYSFSCSKPFQKEALSLLGIRPEQMLAAKDGAVIQADRLLCPSLVNNFELSILRGHELYSKIHMPSWSNEAYSFLLKGDSPSYMSGTSPADKLIYISRNRSGRRRILNEEELLPILKRYAFKTYYLEELGLLEQQQLFASARMVIAPHGAGLVNLVWSREGTTVLELYPQFYHDPSFRILSAAMRLDYHYLICTSPGSQEAAPVDEDILVDKLGLIESFLAERLHISERALSKATDC